MSEIETVELSEHLGKTTFHPTQPEFWWAGMLYLEPRNILKSLTSEAKLLHQLRIYVRARNPRR